MRMIRTHGQVTGIYDYDALSLHEFLGVSEGGDGYSMRSLYFSRCVFLYFGTHIYTFAF